MARKRSFAWLAVSASARADCSASRSWASRSSTRRRSVMSRAIFDAPMISPELSRSGDSVTEMLISWPSARTRTVS